MSPYEQAKEAIKAGDRVAFKAALPLVAYQELTLLFVAACKARVQDFSTLAMVEMNRR